MNTIEIKLEKLKNILIDLGSVAVAYSGGVDSNFLLKVAKDALGDKAIAITLRGMMHSKREMNEAYEYAMEIGVKHIIVDIEKFEVKEFIQNDPRRCYFCKKEVFTTIKNIANENNIKYVVDGTNKDDLGDYRPGLQALEELNIISPLKLAELTKDEIRILSKELDLKTFDKPAFACLATRIPYGETITKEKLEMIEKSEEYLHNKGFKQYRVRYHKDIARIEVGKEEMSKFFNEDLLEETNAALKDIGFKYITLDINGYKTGSMNDLINV